MIPKAMSVMRTIAPQKLGLFQEKIPEIKNNQCLIKLERWSVCGSDIKSGWDHKKNTRGYPICHELAGTIIETKSEKFNVGQRVIALPSPIDIGGLCEFMVGIPEYMAKIPNEGDLSSWVTCQPAGTVLYSCQQIGTIIGKKVLILGQGGIGLSFAAIFARSGASQIICSDPIDDRLSFSKKVGATHVINPSKTSIDDAVAEITNGSMADIVIEAAGYEQTLNDAFRLVKQYGKVIIFGMVRDGNNPSTLTSIATHYLLQNCPTIIPTVGGRSADPIAHIQAMVDLKARGWWDPGELITHQLPFSKAQQAYEMYASRKNGVVKIVLHDD